MPQPDLLPGSFGSILDIHELDLSRPLDKATSDAIMQACVRGRGLLVCRVGRLLSADELMNFSRAFGELELVPGMVDGVGRRGLHPALKGQVPADASEQQQIDALLAGGLNPFIAHIANTDPETGKLFGADGNPYADGECEWHSDMNYLPEPPTMTMLHCHETPVGGGGRTSFVSTIAAFEALSPDEQRQSRTWTQKHDSTYTSIGLIRPGMTVPASPIEAPGHVHPVVQRVPLYGDAEALFLGRRTNAYIMELALPESERALDRLWEHTHAGVGRFTHEWQVGDLVLWDNRVSMHHREPFDPAQRRVMKRTTTVGEAVLPSVASSCTGRPQARL